MMSQMPGGQGWWLTVIGRSLMNHWHRAVLALSLCRGRKEQWK